MKNKLLSLLLALLLLIFTVLSCGETNPGNQGDIDDSGENSESGDRSSEVPGTLPDVEDLPKADPSQVGKTVSASLVKDGRNFFYYSAATGKQRLVTIEEVPEDLSIAKLTIYEPSLQGLSGLVQTLETPFEAKVLGVVNISYQELMYSGSYMRIREEDPYAEKEIINLAAETLPQPLYTLQFYSVFLPGENNASGEKFLVGNMAEKNSPALQGLISVLERIYQRFSLDAALDFDRSALTDLDANRLVVQPQVGEVVTVSLSKEFNYYYYDAESGKEYLLVQSVEIPIFTSTLILYETDFNGIEGLVSAAGSDFSAKVLGNLSLSQADTMALMHKTKDAMLEGVSVQSLPKQRATVQFYHMSRSDAGAWSLYGDYGNPLSAAVEKAMLGIEEAIFAKYPVDEILQFDRGEVSPRRMPAGTLLEVEKLPVADSSSVGKTEKATLKAEGDGFPSNFYYYDANSGKERLITVTPDAKNILYGTLTVYETDFDGIEGLMAAKDTSFDAKVLGVFTVDLLEARYLYYAFGRGIGYGAHWSHYEEEDFLSVDSLPQKRESVQFYSIYLSGDDVTLFGDYGQTRSEALEEGFVVLERVFDRYPIDAVMDFNRDRVSVRDTVD